MRPARIIIVDDEPALLKLMQAYLSRLQYDVRAFPNGTAAWEAFTATPKDVDVVIADLTLPDVSGEELGIRIARANAAVKVLVCSGYPFDIASLPEDVQLQFAAMQKPFLPQALASELKRLLDRES